MTSPTLHPRAAEVPRVSVIIVNYNTASLLPKAIGCLRESAAGIPMEIIIIDNASKDNSVELIKTSFADCHLIINTVNVGFGRANNQAVPLVNGRYVLLLNTDAFVATDTLAKTMHYMDLHPDCGILGVRLIGRDGTLQPCARHFPTPWNLFLRRSGLANYIAPPRPEDDSFEKTSDRNCDWVPGCYYLVRREVIDQVGLFDSRYFLYYEEVDHCMAARKAGWKVVCYFDSTVVHIGGESAKSTNKITTSGRQIDAMQIESELLYFRKNHGIAGLSLNVILNTLSEFIRALAQLIRRKSSKGAVAHAKRTALIWALLRSTCWGTRATR